ncbi:SurA N-terminal domain-containing protein [Streptomyces sp. MJP52]|uniref:SurA N-terminal domain-containing protein n=1 Tax=Streptomyces sp. MJP52 TaxID=2940555 RepID=UPI0024740EA9|nr:SurA N-terminal domain-containing protein [Streptomyces sp. MJP52]MDH6226569.1 FKBP-type peptidyl-prolyl cis-trans isomerase (trigger factor) [Streptomyces sp. MJP52]
MQRRRRRTALLLSAALAAPLLTACGADAHPGAAAVVGGERITQAQVEERVREVRDAQRAVVTEDEQYRQVVAQTGTLARFTVQGMVIDRVLHHAADDAGVEVTPKEVQDLRTSLEQQLGGRQGLENTWLQQYGVAPERLEENLRLQVAASELARRLGAETDSPEFTRALAESSKELGIEINPRYGTWDVEKSARADLKSPWVRDVEA